LDGRSVFEKQYQLKDQYGGYQIDLKQNYLRSPLETYTVSPRSYFAVGDNTRASWDSRFWGPVPEKNLVGTPLIVYWPFGKRWGFVE
jgi:signal peptidase I